jgi:GAF domain-containing protein
VLVADTTKDPNWLPNALLPETRSEIAVPIIYSDEVIGALDVQQNVENGLGQQDSDLLLVIANQIAVALYNARQYEQAQKRAERVATLNAIVEQIQSTHSVETALQVTVRELGRALQASRARVQLSKLDGEKTGVSDRDVS